jgi:hypothetical protein
LLAFSVSIPSPLLLGLSLIASPPTLCSSPNPSLLLLVRHRQNRRRRMIMRSVRHPRRFPGADGSCASPGILIGILLFCVQRFCSPRPPVRRPPRPPVRQQPRISVRRPIRPPPSQCLTPPVNLTVRSFIRPGPSVRRRPSLSPSLRPSVRP